MANQEQQQQEHQSPVKRKCPKSDSDQTPAAASTMDAMFQHMTAEAERVAAESAKKDALIVGLQQTIAGLQEKIKALKQSVSALTTAAAQNDEGPRAGMPRSHPLTLRTTTLLGRMSQKTHRGHGCRHLTGH